MKNILITTAFIVITTNLFAQCDETLTESEKNQLYDSDKIEVKGLVERPTLLTIDSLKKMKVYAGGPFQVMSRTGEVKQELKNFKAVLLRDIVSHAGITLENKANAGTYNYEKGSYYILLTATNGYRILYTYNELMFSSVGDNSYVVFEANGKEITDGGKLIGFCVTDKVTGARNIKWIKSIEVNKLPAAVNKL